MTLSGVFDPVSVRANLEMCLKGREQDKNDHKNSNQWLVKWNDWSNEVITEKVSKWKAAGCVASEEQLNFTAYVLCYVEILHRAFIGHNSKPNPLPIAFPWFGPIFNPVNVEYREALMRTTIASSNPFQAATQQAYLRKVTPLSSPEQFLVEPVFVVDPVFFHHLGLDKCPVSSCTAKIKKRGFTPTGPRTIYGVEFNLKAIGLEYDCPVHGLFSTMSSERWKDIPPWKCDDIPYFRDRSGCTRELFDLVVELRPRLSIGEITESIRQHHIHHIWRLEKKWLASALYEKAKFPDHEIKTFPTAIFSLGTGALKKINPAPSDTFFRDLYEYFMDNQRREESSRYTRTLAGLSIGMDETIKIAKKANIYIPTANTHGTKMKVVNVFNGGLLTGVNEDKELVICELLGTAAAIELTPPLREFAERCDTLGVPFKLQGEICVDRCCSYRSALVAAVPGITVSQDLAHLKNRIMEEVSKKSLHRNALSKDISDALILTYSIEKGVPSTYHSPEDQARHLRQVWEKYSSVSDVQSKALESAFTQQIKHLSNGCLQRRDPTRMSTTSYNENVHKQINKLAIGHASSLTAVEGLLMDFMLRYNLKVNLNNKSQPPHSPSRLFRQQTNGSHHLFLLDHILQQRECLTGIAQPRLMNIFPEHKFGLVARGSESGSTLTKRYAKLDIILKKEEEHSNNVESVNEDMVDEGFIFTSTNIHEDESSNDVEKPAILAMHMQTVATISPPSPADHRFSLPSTALLKRNSDFNSEGSSFHDKTRILNDGSKQIINVIPPTSSPVISHFPPSSLYSSNSEIAQTNSSPPNFATDSPLTSSGMEFYTEGPSDSITEFNLSYEDSVMTVPEVQVASKVGSTSAIRSSFSQSRTMQTYHKHTGVNILMALSESTFPKGSAGFWRFTALRAQEGWSSVMSDEKWVLASQIYNNALTYIHPKFYENHDLPQDSIRRDPDTMKKFCRDLEEDIRKWKIEAANGKSISSWKKIQIGVDVPERLSSVSKGRSIALKICQRCEKYKDGQGNGNNHPRDNCDDGFPIWNRIPYPLPRGLGRPLYNGTKKTMSVDASSCLHLFKILANTLSQQADNIPTSLSNNMQHLRTFEALARRDPSMSLAEAVFKGVDAYSFEPHRFKR